MKMVPVEASRITLFMMTIVACAHALRLRFSMMFIVPPP